MFLIEWYLRQKELQLHRGQRNKSISRQSPGYLLGFFGQSIFRLILKFVTGPRNCETERNYSLLSTRLSYEHAERLGLNYITPTCSVITSW